MRKWYIVIIPVAIFVIIVGIFTALNENPFIPLNMKEQLVRLALSDSRVRKVLDDQPYNMAFNDRYLSMNGLNTDKMVRFVFNNGSYVLVRENPYLHQVISVITTNNKYAIP